MDNGNKHTNNEMSEAAKEARRKYAQKWRQKNVNKQREYMRKWRVQNKDKQKEYQRRYWEKKARENDNT